MNSIALEASQPHTWQKEIDITGAVRGVSKSEILSNCAAVMTSGGSIASLDGVDGATDALKMVAEAGFLRKNALIKERNGKKGLVVAVGVELTHEDEKFGRGKQALVVSEKGAWLQIGKAKKGAVAVNDETVAEYLQKEYAWRLGKSDERGEE